MNEERAWKIRVRSARTNAIHLIKYVSHPDKPHDYVAACAELSKDKATLWADAELTRLRAIVAKVEDDGKIEAIIDWGRRGFLDDVEIARAIRDYLMGRDE